MEKLVSGVMAIYRDGFQIVNIEGIVVFSDDRSFGEDADGNRAIKRTTVEKVIDIMAFTQEEGLTVELRKFDIEQAEHILTIAFLEG